jgi:hypothetical protein
LVSAAQTKKRYSKEASQNVTSKRTCHTERENGRYGDGTKVLAPTPLTALQTIRDFRKKSLGKRSSTHRMVIVILININITVVLNYRSLSLGESYNTKEKIFR